MNSLLSAKSSCSRKENTKTYTNQLWGEVDFSNDTCIKPISLNVLTHNFHTCISSSMAFQCGSTVYKSSHGGPCYKQAFLRYDLWCRKSHKPQTNEQIKYQNEVIICSHMQMALHFNVRYLDYFIRFLVYWFISLELRE